MIPRAFARIDGGDTSACGCLGTHECAVCACVRCGLIDMVGEKRVFLWQLELYAQTWAICTVLSCPVASNAWFPML
jgi:hypothetical protein